MKKTVLFSIAAFVAALRLAAKTADDYVAAGRATLATNHTTAGLQAAYSNFNAAVSLAPNNPTANFLAAATRLLLLPQSPGFNTFLNTLGVPAAGRDIYNWTA